MPVDLDAALGAILALPRSAQPAAVERLLAEWPPEADEAWNSAFGEGSLFGAFTRTSVAQAVYAANRAVIRPLLDARPGFRAVEVGGGDGALWLPLLASDDHGDLVVVDPHPEGADALRHLVPHGVRVAHVPAPVETVTLPPADLVVCSLVLHHVAGWDAAERARVGLDGPGKAEALAHIRAALAAKGGTLVVNEADVYCDLGLPPGDALLRERLCDSYVRRFAVAILDDIARRGDVDDGVRRRWRAMVREWALAQLRVADLPYAARDVYELDVPSWLRRFEASGFRVVSRRFTDPWLLFHQYVLQPA